MSKCKAVLDNQKVNSITVKQKEPQTSGDAAAAKQP